MSQDSIARGLQELQYHVATAYDGNIGLRMFESENFNLVITDINLPGVNGYELCKRIRNRNKQVL